MEVKIVVITANEVKRRGISYLVKIIKNSADEILITLRGKVQLVVVPVDEYERLKELELKEALNEVMKECKEGEFTEETAEDHIKKLGVWLVDE